MGSYVSASWRRHFVRKIAAASAAIACLYVAEIATAETLKVGKAFPTAFGFVPLDVGIRERIFKKYDLSIEATSFGGAPMLIQALTAGAVDIGSAIEADIAMIAKGLPGKGVDLSAEMPTKSDLEV